MRHATIWRRLTCAGLKLAYGRWIHLREKAELFLSKTKRHKKRLIGNINAPKEESYQWKLNELAVRKLS